MHYLTLKQKLIHLAVIRKVIQNDLDGWTDGYIYTYVQTDRQTQKIHPQTDQQLVHTKQQKYKNETSTKMKQVINIVKNGENIECEYFAKKNNYK